MGSLGKFGSIYIFERQGPIFRGKLALFVAQKVTSLHWDLCLVLHVLRIPWKSTTIKNTGGSF